MPAPRRNDRREFLRAPDDHEGLQAVSHRPAAGNPVSLRLAPVRVGSPPGRISPPHPELHRLLAPPLDLKAGFHQKSYSPPAEARPPFPKGNPLAEPAHTFNALSNWSLPKGRLRDHGQCRRPDRKST